MKMARLVLAVMGMFAALAFCFAEPAKAAQELIPMVTPPAGGGAYIIGAGLITVTNKYITDSKMVHEAATGTMDIVRRMQSRESAKKDVFGIFGAVDAWNAYKGNNEYKAKPFSTLRMVTFIMSTDLYLAVPANSPIKSYADVKGKRIGMGGPGSTVANTAHFLLEQHGVTKKDFKPYYYTYKETVEGIQDGSLDGGFIAGGYPIAAYNELSTQRSTRIVPLDEGLVNKLVAEHPYYYRTVVKAKSYKGLEQDTTIMGFATSLWTHTGVSDEYVYKFLKNLFDHRQDYYSIHVSAKELTPDTALKGLSVPLHPGAEKYFKEVGIMKK